MNAELVRAKRLLESGGHTVVACLGAAVYSSDERGVAPLIGWLDEKLDLRGFFVADKVVGKAAAMLYVLLGVSEVYAHVMSEGAVRTLEENGLRPFFRDSAEKIINRDRTGICPMEAAVGDLSDPLGALEAIRRRIKKAVI